MKDSVKGIVQYVTSFEETVANIAIENKFDYVICGHIHQPKIKEILTSKGRVTYLNSGDWIENLTALEYHNGEWSIYKHDQSLYEESLNGEIDKSNKELFNEMLVEFNMMKDQ